MKLHVPFASVKNPKLLKSCKKEKVADSRDTIIIFLQNLERVYAVGRVWARCILMVQVLMYAQRALSGCIHFFSTHLLDLSHENKGFKVDCCCVDLGKKQESL